MPDFTDLTTLLAATLMVPRAITDGGAVVGHDPMPVVDRRCERTEAEGCPVPHTERWWTLILQCALCTELHVSVVRFAHPPDGERWACPHCGTTSGFQNKGTARRLLEKFTQGVEGA
jgi:hypothetical protein